MKLGRLFHIRKARKYPILRDREGMSLRARCFELFDQGKRPTTVEEELKIKETTVFRYYRDWKRLGADFERRYAFTKGLFKKTAPERDSNIELFTRALGISKEQFEAILLQPYGLHRFLEGKLYFPANADVDHKMCVSLELALLISNHLTKNGGKFEDVYHALNRWMREAMRHRQFVDKEIEEENKFMAIVHKALVVEMERERQGRFKPDTFSEEERNALIGIGLRSKYKKLQALYWVNIGSLMADGLTKEQAREKLYQEMAEQGDPKLAKLFREFQDKVHPLENGVEPPPPTPPQPPVQL